jgi:glycosyltransferase involved in cell wall biosynthesis
MTELRTRGIDAVLDATIADDDDREYVGMLRNRVREAGLQDIVRFVGRVTGFRFLADADIMISPSTSESFGFPLIEAMASGVPVVATSIPATKELLGSFGWYFPIGNASLAADQVIAICESDPVDLMVRLEGARKVAAGFSWEINAEYIARLAEEVMGARDD